MVGLRSIVPVIAHPNVEALQKNIFQPKSQKSTKGMLHIYYRYLQGKGTPEERRRAEKVEENVKAAFNLIFCLGLVSMLFYVERLFIEHEKTELRKKVTQAMEQDLTTPYSFTEEDQDNEIQFRLEKNDQGVDINVILQENAAYPGGRVKVVADAIREFYKKNGQKAPTIIIKPEYTKIKYLGLF